MINIPENPESKLKLIAVRVGGDKNLGYLFGAEGSGEWVAVDPGDGPDAILEALRREGGGGRIVLILATHSHADHVRGIPALAARTGAPLGGHPDLPGVRVPLTDGDERVVAGVSLRTIHCPGHCDDSALYLLDGRALLTGDELFVGGVGKTGPVEQIRRHYDSLRAKLMTLPDGISIHPGHDYGASPSSTIGEQRRTNPYLLQPDFESFRHLRVNWKEYCRLRGIAWG